MKPDTYNILSLDGGGTWAIIEAIALGNLFGYQTRGHDILQHFRLVVANSGGSIIAAGLWADMTPAQLVAEFQSESIRSLVFSKRPFYKRLTRMVGFGPKYLTNRKKDALAAIMERYSKGLASSLIENLKYDFNPDVQKPTALVIIGYDYDTNRAKYFRSNPGSLAGTQFDKPKATTSLVEAVHASTNAPVNYFDDPAEIMYGGSRLRMWDGAIAGYNNPILAGITEALANGVDRQSIQILSLGTGSRMLPRKGPETPDSEHEWLLAGDYLRSWPFLISDVHKLATSIVENPPDVATYTAHLMIGDQLPPKDASANDPRRTDIRLVRLNPMMQPTINQKTKKFDTPAAGTEKEEELDDAAFFTLLRMDMDAVRDTEVAIIFRFAKLWEQNLVYNQPILASATNLSCELGHRWFKDARDQAYKLGLARKLTP